MTESEFEQRLRDQPITIKPLVTVQDWGSTRGQGRRAGRQVLGGMSAAPTGIKKYSNPFGLLPDYKDIAVEVHFLEGLGREAYLRARSAGCNHEVAMRWTYEVRGVADPGFTYQYMIGMKASGTEVEVRAA